MTAEQRIEELEVLLYGCLVEFSKGDEADWVKLYDRAWAYLGLPDRMQELKAKWLAGEGK